MTKKSNDLSSPLTPSVALLCKLGSIIVHIDEGFSKDGHLFDMVALQTLITDPEVRAWLTQMDSMAMLPRKRNRP